jgi:hypothetical protein
MQVLKRGLTESCDSIGGNVSRLLNPCFWIVNYKLTVVYIRIELEQ